MPRAIGVIDGLEVIDPDTGEARWVTATGGLRFSFCDPLQPGARMQGRIAVRNGGMCVFETVGNIEGVQTQRGVTAHDAVAADRTPAPPSAEVAEELRAQHAAQAQAPRRRQGVPAAP